MSGVQWRFVQVPIVHCHLTALIFTITNIGLDCCGCMHFFGSKLAEVQKDLECSNEECKKHKQDIEILQVLYTFSCPSRSLCRLNWPRFFKSVKDDLWYLCESFFRRKHWKLITWSWRKLNTSNLCLTWRTSLGRYILFPDIRLQTQISAYEFIQVWQIVICCLRTEWRASWAWIKQAYPTWTWVGRSSAGILWPPDRASGMSIKSCISLMNGGEMLLCFIHEVLWMVSPADQSLIRTFAWYSGRKILWMLPSCLWRPCSKMTSPLR